VKDFIDNIKLELAVASHRSLIFRLRAKVPEKRVNFNSNAADRLWGGGMPASNNWASGAGESCFACVWQYILLTFCRSQCAQGHSALVSGLGPNNRVGFQVRVLHRLFVEALIFLFAARSKLRASSCFVGRRFARFDFEVSK
jgi:hypothetical protein